MRTKAGRRAIAREEHGDVEGAGHRRVVEHVDGEGDVNALLLRPGERAEVDLEVELLHRAEHLLPLARHLLLLAETREDEDAHHLDGALRVRRVPQQLGREVVGDDLGDLAEVDVVVLVPAGAKLLDDRAALPALEQRVVQPRAVDEDHHLCRLPRHTPAAELGGLEAVALLRAGRRERGGGRRSAIGAPLAESYSAFAPIGGGAAAARGGGRRRS